MITAMQSIAREVSGSLVGIRGSVDVVEGFVTQTGEASERQQERAGEVSINVRTTAEGVAGIARNLDEWLAGIEDRCGDDRVRTSCPVRIEVAPEFGRPGRVVACLVRNHFGWAPSSATRTRAYPTTSCCASTGSRHASIPWCGAARARSACTSRSQPSSHRHTFAGGKPAWMI